MTRILPLLAMAACADPMQGVAVGNPGQGMTARLEWSSDVASVRAEIEVSRITAESCSGRVTSDAYAASLDLSGEEALPVPAGRLCSLTVGLDAPLVITGTLASDDAFLFELDVPEITVANAEGFRRGVPMLLVLGPGPWLSGEIEGTGQDTVRPGEPGHDEVAALVGQRSFLCEDGDGDGVRAWGDQILAWGPGNDGAPPPLPGWQSVP